jgi:hypothetical protein
MRVRVRKLLRLLVLYFFVMMEYFQRTGANATKDPVVMMTHRRNVRKLAGDKEFALLYDKTDPPTEADGVAKRKTGDLTAKVQEAIRKRGVKDVEAWKREFRALKCKSVSHANPMTVLFWLQLVIRRLCIDSRDGGKSDDAWKIDAPLECLFYSHLGRIEQHYCQMEQVDKLAFAFP